MSNPATLNIALDKDGEEPIYRQLIRYIRTQIDSSTLPPGTRLPASRDLADQLDISRISVVNAYAELRAEGYLSAHAGRGTFVAGGNGGDGHTNGDNMPYDDATNVGLSGLPDYSLREMMRLAHKPGVINFSYGVPPMDFLPVQPLKDALNVVLERDGSAALNYEMPEGFAPLRHAVRDYVSSLGIQCSADDVMITDGTQQAIDLVIQSLVSEGETLVTENPTYLGVIDIARVRRVRVHGIEMDDDGIRLDMLENYLVERRPKLIFVMPTFHNPTGKVMSLHRRRQLLNLAADYNVPILEDGVYHEFRFEGKTLPPLKALDETNNVIHASGFTKIMLPGLRIGYIICTGSQYERLVRIKQAADISTSSLMQRAIHLLLQRGVLAQQLERNGMALRQRRDAVLEAASRHMPPGTRWNVPRGGLYLWMELPRTGPSAAELYITAAQMGVAYAIGNVFYTNGCGSHRLRINYGAQPPVKIEEGFMRLGAAWCELAGSYAERDKSPLL